MNIFEAESLIAEATFFCPSFSKLTRYVLVPAIGIAMSLSTAQIRDQKASAAVLHHHRFSLAG